MNKLVKYASLSALAINVALTPGCSTTKQYKTGGLEGTIIEKMVLCVDFCPNQGMYPLYHVQTISNENISVWFPDNERIKCGDKVKIYLSPNTPKNLPFLRAEQITKLP
jgi:hypothetical protein